MTPIKFIVGKEINRRCEKCHSRLIAHSRDEKKGQYLYQCPKCLIFYRFFEKVF